jgi:hypothetical protein
MLNISAGNMNQYTYPVDCGSWLATHMRMYTFIINYGIRQNLSVHET